MSCCIESAIVETLKTLEDSPVHPDNHFVLTANCSDCRPYVVVKSVNNVDFRTSCGTRMISTVTITGHFATASSANEFKTLCEEWITASPCVDVGECGCLCQIALSSSAVAPVSESGYRYSLVFKCHYRQGSLTSSS
jgi:hypothetical protein